MNHPLLFWPFVGLVVLLAIGFVAALYASGLRTGKTTVVAGRMAMIGALATMTWLAVTGIAAAAGVLNFEGVPPTGFLMLVLMWGLVLWLGFSRIGTQLATGLPLWILVGYQGFRIGVELLLHRAYTVGLMPVQMSYEGLNFDIVSGITAVIVAGLLLAGRLPRWVVGAWNALGFVLLMVIVTIALLSTPTPLRVFMNEPENVWITHAPWVWLPTVMVAAALLGHILVFRKLRMTSAKHTP